MTYWLAWKTRDTAFVIADSAITFRGKSEPPPRPFSSFGERHIHKPDEKLVVAEFEAKISEIDDVLYTFCGDFKLGKSIGESLKSALTALQSPAEAFALALTSNGPFNVNRPVEAAIIFHRHGRPRIFVADVLSDREPREVDNVADGGSLPKYLSNQLRRIPDALLTRELPPLENLMILLCVMQSLSVHEYLMELGVGGAYQGLGVNADGIVRPASCSYQGYDGTMRMSAEDLVGVVQQRGMIITKTPSASGLIHLNSLFFDDAMRTSGEFRVRDLQKLTRFETEFFAFIHSKRRRVVLLDRRYCPEGAFPVATMPDGLLKMHINSALNPLIFDPPNDAFSGIEVVLVSYSRTNRKRLDISRLKVPL